MTPAEPSHRGVPQSELGRRSPIMQVLIRIDAAGGESPVLVDDDEGARGQRHAIRVAEQPALAGRTARL